MPCVWGMTSGPPASSSGPFSSAWESQPCCRPHLDAGETGLLSGMLTPHKASAQKTGWSGDVLGAIGASLPTLQGSPVFLFMVKGTTYFPPVVQAGNSASLCPPLPAGPPHPILGCPTRSPVSFLPPGLLSDPLCAPPCPPHLPGLARLQLHSLFTLRCAWYLTCPLLSAPPCF